MKIESFYYLCANISVGGAEAISDAYHKTFPKEETTAFVIVYVSAFITLLMYVYAKVSMIIARHDRPDFLGIMCIGAGILDVSSDYQMAYQL